jgi:hypothetical protein
MEEHEDPDPAPAAPGKVAPATENLPPVPEIPSNPPRYGRHRPHPREHVHAILQAYAVWDGSTDEFCEKHKVYRGTLWAWRRQYRKEHGDKNLETSLPPKIAMYSPDESGILQGCDGCNSPGHGRTERPRRQDGGAQGDLEDSHKIQTCAVVGSSLRPLTDVVKYDNI